MTERIPSTEAGHIYDRIYDVVRNVPAGKVTTYGMVARIAGGCTARMVGYAMAALAYRSEGDDVPWQRVINAKGMISPHGAGAGSFEQRRLLEEEGVEFSPDGVVDFERYGWPM
jgi:methylated-DNA-protein-cysteine methyltransferase-like protein